MQHLPLYTALTAAVLMMMQLALMLLVGFNRRAFATSIGDGGHTGLLLAIRRHGNLAENAPLFLILLGLLEIMRGSTLFVLLIACAFVTARILHAVGLTLNEGANAPRALGALGTLVCGLILAIYLFYITLSFIT